MRLRGGRPDGHSSTPAQIIMRIFNQNRGGLAAPTPRDTYLLGGKNTGRAHGESRF